jgi:FkbM family methyltransferase
VSEGNIDRLIQQRFFANAATGVFVDVGAAHPEYLSNSALFRSLGWHVIAIEPNPAFCDLHRAKGFEVLPYACGDHDEDGVSFSVVDSHDTAYAGGKVSYESFSSLQVKDSYRALKPNLDEKHIQVNVRRLDTILNTLAPDITRIDILSIDVEGWELEVLNGLSLQRFQPRVMLIENLLEARSYRQRLAGLGYLLWKRLPPNDVYVRAQSLGIAEALQLRLYGKFVDLRYSQ